MSNKVALCTGVTGQDGYYLTKLLLQKGYKVVGIKRRTSAPTTSRLNLLQKILSPAELINLTVEDGDITDYISIARLVRKYKPHEFYNLAAQSFVTHSFNAPIVTAQITGLGALNCLEAIKNEMRDCRFYQASSSEMFGNAAIHCANKPIANGKYEVVLDESSHMVPRSPYGAAKLFAHNMTRNYREAYKMFAVGGILFNHESPLRGEEFVTRKITRQLALIATHRAQSLSLGNLDSYRDWGHAEDFCRAMWLMLQQSAPKDYVIATGKTFSIQEFLNIAFSCIKWPTNCRLNHLVKQDPALIRPSEVDILIGNSQLARQELGWSPFYNFIDLVHSMVGNDLAINNASNLLRPIKEVEEQYLTIGSSR